MQVDVRTPAGDTAGSVDLDDAVFGVQPNVPVMHQVVTAQLAARRAGTQSTLTRAEVAGGGSKPWRQKGTGRARQGSTRAPHWKGGGVALGPKPRSYRQRTPKKMVQLALRSALSDRAADGKVVVVDDWGWTAPRTKDAVAAIAALGLTGRVLVVAPRDAEAVWKSFRNLGHVHVLSPGELNAYDVLCSDWVVFTRATLPGNAQPAAAEPTAAAGDAKPVAAADEAEPAATDEAAADEAAADEAAADEAAEPAAATEEAES